jgi:hypothetical protein
LWIGVCCITAASFYALSAWEAGKRRRLYEANGANTSLWQREEMA